MPSLLGSVMKAGKSPESFPNGGNLFGHTSHTQACYSAGPQGSALGQVGTPSLPEQPPLWPVELKESGSFQPLTGSLPGRMGQLRERQGTSTDGGIVSPRDTLLNARLMETEFLLSSAQALSTVSRGLISLPVTSPSPHSHPSSNL